MANCASLNILGTNSTKAGGAVNGLTMTHYSSKRTLSKNNNTKTDQLLHKAGNFDTITGRSKPAGPSRKLRVKPGTQAKKALALAEKHLMMQNNKN